MDGDTREAGERKKLGRIIKGKAREIERRWLDAVERELSASHVDPSALRDGIGEYLALLAEALERGEAEQGEVFPAAAEGLAAWEKVAREHGVTRVRLGFDIDELVHEFTLLWRVIAEVAHEQGLGSRSPTESLTELVGAAVEAAVRSYVDSRDYQSRRVQAQHLGFLTHELRNPLMTAMMALGQMERAESESLSRPLAVMSRSLERMKKMIDEVLAVERLEGGELKPRPTNNSLSEILDAALLHARSDAAAKGLTLDVPPTANVDLYVDSELTISVIHNLVDNAVNYTDRGTISLTLEERSDSVVIHVRDNCQGISDEELAIIFEPFRRGESQHGKPGTGLGLAIAKRAAEAQGGALGAESKDERGCHFWFQLPKNVMAHLGGEPSSPHH